MKRLTLVLALVAVVSTVGQQAAAQTDQQRTETRPCDFQWYTGPHAPPSTYAVYRMTACFARRFHLSVTASQCRVREESHGYAYARNGRFYGPLQIGYNPDRPHAEEWGTYFGAIQSWASVKQEWPGPFNARASVIAGLWHAHKYGWGAWTTCR